jgi:hypothetical protein
LFEAPAESARARGTGSCNRQLWPRGFAALLLFSGMRWLLAVLATFVTVSAASAALLFQDRHVDASGQETVYRFEATVAPAASTVNQEQALKTAISWATPYYGLRTPGFAEIQQRSMPTHFWLVALTIPDRGKNETFFAVVLPSGAVLEPKVTRRPALTATASASDSSKDTELQAPEKGLEIHGEMEFDYSWGKGLRPYGPFVPNPLWAGPGAPFHP